MITIGHNAENSTAVQFRHGKPAICDATVNTAGGRALKTISNPPDAASLMMSARSFGSYDLAGALADLIDNSIKAKARNISITCLYSDGNPTVSVIDDGEGMTRDELEAAMRPASTNPADERSPDDLGRFGWGMKSASFSQCRKLTVLTASQGEVSGAVWDLDNIDGWSMGILERTDVEAAATRGFAGGTGTEIQWSKCDRLSENGGIAPREFNELVSHTGDRLSLVFHRYIEGSAKTGNLNIQLNGRQLSAFDPFHKRHDATQTAEPEELEINGRMVVVRPYILPHYSKLKEDEYEKLGGEEGFLRNQGFYVYRNDRLIIHGTWFRLAKYGDLSQLVRISVDIPNALDDTWRITVDKSDAQLPAVLRNRLRQIVNGLRTRASRVYRARGGRIDNPNTVSVWARHARNNEIRYSVNREHPVIARLLNSENADDVRTMLQLVERNFPVGALVEDTTDGLDPISQTSTSREEMTSLLDRTIPGLLDDCSGDIEEMVRKLSSTEPFDTNWPMVEDYIRNKRWP